jgi:hypothetical protein
LILGAAVGLAVVQAVLHLLARGLGLRVHRHATVAALTIAVVLVMGFVVADRVLFPTIVVSRNLPGAPPSTLGENYNVLNDAVYQLIPWEAEVRRALRSGRLPLWSDRLDGGSSPWVNPQAGAISPVAMAARMVPLRHHLLVALAVKVVIGFQGAWLLARLLGSRRVFALFAGAGFSLGGGIMPWSLFPLSATAAWIPWLAVGSIRLARGSSPKTIAATAVIAALMLLSGHPETAVGGGMLAAVCGASFGRRRHGFRGAAWSLFATLIAAVLGLALAAPHILPFAMHLPHTIRFHQMSDGNQHESPVSGALLNPRRAHFLKGALNPHAFGRAPYSNPFFVPLGGGGYAGVIALAGTAIALALRRRRCWPLVVVACFIALLIAEFLPLRVVVTQLPVVRTVDWTRLITIISLVLAVCGAVGFTELARHRRASLLVAALAAAAVSLVVSPQPFVAALWASAIVATAMTAWKAKFGIVLLAAVLLVDHGRWSTAMLPKGDPALFYPETPFMSGLTTEVETQGSCRVVGQAREVYPSLLAMYSIADVRYHNPVADHAYAQVLDSVLGFHSLAEPHEYTSPIRRLPSFLDFLNVGCVVSGGSSLPGRFEPFLRQEDGRRAAYRNPGVLPITFLPKDYVIVEPNDVLRALVSNQDPRVVVLSRDEAEGLELPPSHWWPNGVTSSTDTLGRVRLNIRRQGGVIVATSLTQPRGWVVTSDGRRLETITVNHAFLGVVVPAGVKTAELEFVPPGFRAGVALGAVGVVAVVVLLLWPAMKRRWFE